MPTYKFDKNMKIYKLYKVREQGEDFIRRRKFQHISKTCQSHRVVWAQEFYELENFPIFIISHSRRVVVGSVHSAVVLTHFEFTDCWDGTVNPFLYFPK